MKSFFLHRSKGSTFVLSLCTIGLISLIFIQSSHPPPKIFGVISGLDKLAHFSVYCILTLLMLAILQQLSVNKKLPVILLTLIAVFCTGLFNEIHQSSVPTRNATGWDLLANTFGSLFAVTLFKLQFIRKKISRATS